MSVKVGSAVASLALALVAGAVLVFAPLFVVVEVSVEPGQEGVFQTSRRTLLAQEGPSILAVLAMPVLLSSAGLIAVRRSNRRVLTVMAVAYGAGVLLALASVGLFFVPSLGALVFARLRS